MHSKNDTGMLKGQLEGGSHGQIWNHLSSKINNDRIVLLNTVGIYSEMGGWREGGWETSSLEKRATYKVKEGEN